MNVKHIANANLALAVVIVASMVVCLIGPLAEPVGLAGAWLFLWPFALLIIRFLAFLMLPVLAVLLLYVTLRRAVRRRADIILAGANLAGCALLILVVFGIERSARLQAMDRINAEFGNAKIETLLQNSIVGRQLPQLALKSTNGADVKLRDEIQSGKLTAIVFWASYDQAWSGDIAAIKATLAEFESRGLRAIAINEGESPEVVSSFIRHERLNFPVFLDSGGRFFKECGLGGSIEQILLVDTNGIALEQLKDGDFNQTLPKAVSKRLPPQ